MTKSEKLAIFWLGMPELPNEIKGIICDKFWKDQKLIKESQEAYFLALAWCEDNQVYLSPKTFAWWGYTDHNELCDAYFDWPKKERGDFLQVVQFYDTKEKRNLLVMRRKNAAVVVLAEAIKKILKQNERK